MTANPKPRNEYYWSDEREPHFDRRKAIMESHPEVTSLIGIDTTMKYKTIVLVAVQMTIAFYASQLGWIPFLLVAYFIGASISHALFLAIHEITHYLAFESKRNNNILAFFANIPIVLPYAMSFKVYHAMHHWEQGKDGIDTDIPARGEAMFFNSFVGKILWFVSQIVFYAFRPMMIKRIKVDEWQVYNFIFQAAVMAAFLPFAGWYGLLYLGISLVFAGGIHPTSGHFISEHYVFHEGQETYSYYGPLNAITFNVGYHNEHHDFPNVPGTRLPALKNMAPEYYDNLHSYNSWVGVIWQFLTDRNVTLFSRTKRK
jgi:sphingolipid 4-desaturase/C4-monooxygenase